MTRSRFNPREGLIVVPARLWGPSGTVRIRLALDTGATSTVVNADILRLLGYDPAVAEERTRITTASGVEYAAKLALLRLMAVGVDKVDFDVLCHTLPTSTTVDGLLGLDFLRGRRVSLDFREGWIEVT